jgi:hypothetical protein
MWAIGQDKLYRGMLNRAMTSRAEHRDGRTNKIVLRTTEELGATVADRNCRFNFLPRLSTEPNELSNTL